MRTITLENSLTWSEIAEIADGARLKLSESARARVIAARKIVDAVVARDIRSYGLNTGVGAFQNVRIDRDKQRQMSRNVVMSHSAAVGAPLGIAETRAIIAAQVNNFAHGYSGVRIEVVDHLLLLLNEGCTPVVPSKGSVGYLVHMAHISAVLIGEGFARIGDEVLPASEAFTRLGRTPLVLDAKEGLSLVNGSPCATGLASLALARGEHLLDWADAIAALSFEALSGQLANYAEESKELHRSPGLNDTAAVLRAYLGDSKRLLNAGGSRTQDALSVRAIPHVHGAARDAFTYVKRRAAGA